MMEDIKFLLSQLRKAKANNQGRESNCSPDVRMPKILKQGEDDLSNEYQLTMKDIEPCL